MNVTLAIGTEKGGYVLTGSGRRWKLERPLFPGWKVSSFGWAADGTFLAGLGSNWFGASVHRSKDLGKWEQVTAGPTWPEGSGRKLKQIWTFHLAGDRLYAGVDEAGLFKSDDHGLTWEPVLAINEYPTRSKWFPGAGGLCAHRILTSYDRIWVGISAVGVFRSDDGGNSFHPVNSGVTPTATPDADKVEEAGYCVHGLVADPERPDRIWRQEHTGVYRSEDGGDTWERIERGLPAGFGFALARSGLRLFVVPLQSDENRLPVKGRLRAYASDDGGDSWKVAGRGWKRAATYTAVLRGAVDTDQQGGVHFGTTGGKVWTSPDAGHTWRELAFTFPRILAVKALGPWPG